jgi:triacylglycerol lipase
MRAERWRRAAWGPVAVAMASASGVAAAPADPAPPGHVDVPVLLVPGWLDNERELAALRIRLMAAGWDQKGVFAMTFDDATGSNREHAEEISRAVDDLREKTGAPRVDIVAHSMGGLATRLYLRETSGATVRRVVFIATPHRGTYMAYLAFGEGREEMQPDSDFLRMLNEGPPVPPGIEAMTIRSRLDAVILPPESALLPHAENREVCCPTHAGLLDSVDAFRLVRRFLEDGPEAPP